MDQAWESWGGGSGFEYLFHVYGRDEPVPARQGLYIYCRKGHGGGWSPVYMGQGDLSVCCADPDLLARIDGKGATHVHMRLCTSPDERAAELADLLAKHRDAFGPHGCNAAAAEAPGAETPGTAAVPPGGSAPVATA